MRAMDLTIWVWCPHCMAGHQIKPADAVLEGEIQTVLQPVADRGLSRARLRRARYRLSHSMARSATGRRATMPPRSGIALMRRSGSGPLSYRVALGLRAGRAARGRGAGRRQAGLHAGDDRHRPGAGGARWPDRAACRRPRGPARRHRSPAGRAPIGGAGNAGVRAATSCPDAAWPGHRPLRPGCGAGGGATRSMPASPCSRRCWRRATPGWRPISAISACAASLVEPRKRPRARPALAFGPTRIM